MKPMLFLLSFLIFTTLKSQITVEFTAPAPVIKFSTTNLGDKYFMLTNADTSEVLTIYNADWTVRRVDTLPDSYQYVDFNQEPGSTITLPNIRSISDNLFNSDSLIEFLAYRYTTYPGYYKMAVINELGQILFVFPDSAAYSYMPLFDVSGNFKTTFLSINSNAYKIYSLPGTLPCNQCSVTTGIVSPSQNDANISLNAYPNPFNNTLVVQYNLQQQQEGQLTLTTVDGKVVNTIHLNQSQNTIELNTANMPQGIIIASLYDNNQQLVSKKLVKIE